MLSSAKYPTKEKLKVIFNNTDWLQISLYLEQ